MAKQTQQDLFDVLRSSGLRKKVAWAVSRSANTAATNARRERS